MASANMRNSAAVTGLHRGQARAVATGTPTRWVQGAGGAALGLLALRSGPAVVVAVIGLALLAAPAGALPIIL